MNLLLYFLHGVFVTLLTGITLFSNNYIVLFVAAHIILVTIIINYFVGDCPITLIEDNYGKTSIDNMIKLVLPKKYHKRAFRPLITLNMLWIGLMLIAIKILVLLTIKTFKPTLTILLKNI